MSPVVTVPIVISSGTTILIGNNFTVKYINSVSASLGDAIQPTTPPPSGSTRDVFTYNLQVLDTAGIPISGATTQLINASGSTIFNTTTNISGNIPTQEATLFLRNISGGLGPVQNLSPYTLSISRTGYNTYTEKTIYSQSIALEKTVSLTPTSSLITINLS